MVYFQSSIFEFYESIYRNDITMNYAKKKLKNLEKLPVGDY